MQTKIIQPQMFDALMPWIDQFEWVPTECRLFISFHIPNTMVLDHKTILMYFEKDVTISFTRDPINPLKVLKRTISGTIKDDDVARFIVARYYNFRK